MTVTPWFAQPEEPLGTALLLSGRQAGIATPLLHWPASLLTETGWSVLGYVDPPVPDGSASWDAVETSLPVERQGAAPSPRTPTASARGSTSSGCPRARR